MSCNDNSSQLAFPVWFPSAQGQDCRLPHISLPDKSDSFRENNFIVFPTIQFLPFLLMLNEGSSEYGCDENLCDVEFCPLREKTVLYIWAKQHLSADVNNFWSSLAILDLTRPAACTIETAHCSLSEKWRPCGNLWPFFVDLGLLWANWKDLSYLMISGISLWWILGDIPVMRTVWKTTVF